MPSTLTTGQLQYAKSLLSDGTPEAMNSFYAYMSGQGYGYANLAIGLINCSTFSGNTAQAFMLNAAQQQGLSLTANQISNIELTMAYGYINTLIGNSNGNNGTVTQDVTYQQALQFHSDAFSVLGLTSDTWTLSAPGKALDSTYMQWLWSKMIDSDPAVSNTAAAELTAAVDGRSQLTHFCRKFLFKTDPPRFANLAQFVSRGIRSDRSGNVGQDQADALPRRPAAAGNC